MKKSLICLLFTVPFFSFTTSTAVENEIDCDALAEEWYNQTYEGDYTQEDATRVYLLVHADCYLNGRDSSFTAYP